MVSSVVISIGGCCVTVEGLESNLASSLRKAWAGASLLPLDVKPDPSRDPGGCITLIEDSHGLPATGLGARRVQLPDGVAWLNTETRTINFERGDKSAILIMEFDQQRAWVCGKGRALREYLDGAISMMLADQFDISGRGAILRAGFLVAGSGAVLIVGPPGSGKSTFCAVALDQASALYGGDDFCAVELRATGAVVIPIRRTLAIDSRFIPNVIVPGVSLGWTERYPLAGRERSYWQVKPELCVGSDEASHVSAVIAIGIHNSPKSVMRQVSDQSEIRGFLDPIAVYDGVVTRYVSHEDVIKEIISSTQGEIYEILLSTDLHEFPDSIGRMWKRLQRTLVKSAVR